MASIDAPLHLAPPRAVSAWRMLPSRILTFCLVELMRLRHDRAELYTRAIQPILWLLLFGETFTRIRAIPTGNRPYIDFLAPGIMAQSALFIAIFYGIQIIWERDAGMLTKLLATHTPRAALITGKAFAAGIRGLAQVIVILILSAILRVGLDWNPAASPRRRPGRGDLRGVLCLHLLGAARHRYVA